MLKAFLRELRPIETEECLGPHQQRPLTKVGAFSVGCKLTSSAVSFGGTIILSRLVSPEAFGVYAVGFFFIALFSTLSNAGFLEAAIQTKDLCPRQANAAFWLNAVLGAVLAMAFIGSSPFLASVYGMPSLPGFALALGGTFALANLAAPLQMILTRGMRAEISLAITLVSQGLGLAAGIVLAFEGFGLWALAWQFVASAASEAVALAYFVRWRPRLAELRDPQAALVKYGCRSMIAHLSSYLSLNLHILALGHGAGAVAAGQYNRAQRLFQMPAQQLVNPLLSAAFPAMAAMQDRRESVGDLVARGNWVVCLFLLPFAAVMVVFGDWITVWLLGREWLTAGHVVQWLAVAQVPMMLNASLAKGNAAIGRPGRGLWVSLGSMPLLAAGLIHFAPQGAVATAAFLAFFRWLTYPVFTWINLRNSGFSAPRYVKASLQLAALAASSTMLAYGLRAYAGDSQQWLNIAVTASAALASYALFVAGCQFTHTGRSILQAALSSLEPMISRRSDRKAMQKP